MAKVFKIQDPAPNWGDAEGEFLADNFDLEWESEDVEDAPATASMVRVTRDRLSRVRAKFEKAAANSMEKHMLDCLVIMLDRKEWVDLLVWR